MAFSSKLGFNASWNYYYTEEYIFTDLMKGASSWFEGTGWTVGEFTSYINGRSGSFFDDWLPSLPAGKSTYCIVRGKLTEESNGGTYPVEIRYPRTRRTGIYYVTWTGSAQVTVSTDTHASTITNISSNRIQVNTGSTGLIYLSLTVTNTGSSPITVNDIKVFHADDESDLNAGKIINSIALQKFKGSVNLRALDLIRTMDWGNVNEDGSTNTITNYIGTSDLPSLTSKKWISIPGAALGKMAGEISSVNGNRPIDIWIPVPVRMNQAAWSQYLTDVYNNHPSGKVKIEAGNEIWNTMYPFNLQVDWYNQIYIRGAENGGDNIQRPVYTASGVVYPTPYNVNGSLGSYTYSYTTTGSTSSVDHLRMYSTGTNAEGGITISLPASTEQRTAKLYIMGYGSTVDSLSMSLVCTMSDSSASQTVNYTLVNQGNDNYLVVDLTYRAGSAGQTLNAYWRMNGYSGVSAVRAVHFGAAWVSNPGTTGAAAISATITATGGNVDITALGGADYLISRNGQTIANGFRKTGGGSTISVVEVDTTDAYTVDHEDKAPRAYSATDSTPSMSSNTATIPSWEIAQCMMAHQAVDRWVTAETIYGRSRVLRTICGQSTNQGFAAYSLLTQTSKLGTTDTVAKKMDVFAVGNYIKMGVASTTNECRTDSLVAEKFNENVNAHQEYYNRLKIYIDNVLVPSHTSSMSDLAAKGATQASLMAYECWRHTNTLILQDAYGTLGQFTVNTSDNTLTYVPDTAGLFSAYSIITRDEIFENGDVIRFNVITHIPTGTASYSSGALLIPLTQFPGEYLVDGQLYVRRVSTDKISLHRTYTDAINNTNIITLQATVDAVKGANITRIKAIEDIQRNFAKSELGRKIFIYWWNVCVRPFFKEVNLYTQAGRWNDGFGTTWGLVENSFVSDHVAAVQARKVNNIGVTCSDLLSS